MNETILNELRATVRGDVLFDDVSRALYATDASIYQIDPVGVVLPRDEADIAAVLHVARKHHVPIVPRGGGTSLAGQAIGPAIILDCSKYMNRLLEVNVEEGWAWVEPGMVLDHLNAALAPQGVKFAPDVSPANRATIGGMISTNAAGMYSIVYGKTIDHVLELKVMLTDGSVTTLDPLTDDELREKLTADSLEGRAYRTVRRLSREHAAEIAERYPKVLRRVGGYNLDAFVPNDERRTTNDERATDNPPSSMVVRPSSAFNLAKMIVGSEGTLAIILAAKLRLVPRPRHTGIGVLHFRSLDDALDAVMPCLACHPSALELIDDVLMDLTRKSLEYAPLLASFTSAHPHALLQAEFFGDTPEEVREKLNGLERHVRATGWHEPFTIALTAQEKSAILEVRKAAMPLLMSISPDRKPETFVEDTSVPPERLGEYIRRFREIVQAHGTQASFYGHASVGVIHARPLVNLHQAEGVTQMRQIAEEVRDLVIEFGGAFAGEHGDGIARSEFNRELFGPTLYSAFQEVKRTFDPHGLLNPNKVVDALPMDSHLRFGKEYHVAVPLETHFHFRDTGGFAGAVELCNGNGLCRKTSSGTMCPSYMVTRAEEHSTRGRANALRMVLSGALPPEELTSERMHEVLDLCIECKGCTAECPSRVNMTRIKSEWLSHYHDEHGTPLRARLFGNIRTINQLGSAIAPLANMAIRMPGVNVISEKLLGISRHRSLPQFASTPFHQWFEQHQLQIADCRLQIGNQSRPSSMTVVLFPDTFADYNDPHIAQAAVRVLEAAGYEVLLPRRPVCCGRPMLSKGLLREAKALAQQQMEWLAPYAEAGMPIVGLEPSCILTFRDEYPDLLDDPRAAVLARQSFLIDEFLAGEVREGRATLPFELNHEDTKARRNNSNNFVSSCLGGEKKKQFLLHGHCHQKALVGSGAALELLRMIPGADVREVDSGCCGMAGSFGYEAEHYEISQKIGERALLPAVRALPPEAQVVAMGTSCRQQIADFSGRRAKHLVEVLAEALES
ncbi:MAG TPA: FAD-linked oxidase C-terminal domain-containing protein [Roseiflexaceae bacterium]|nr:FAD-linked oxidase C-terminal domain-containing protein [Roseiflexaceae bacterium]